MARNRTPLATRRDVLLGASGAALAAACAPLAGVAPSGDRAVMLGAMQRATRFMRNRCAVHGGYVRSYAADFARRWGEMEAYPAMIWIQSPGTATVGHLYLDCYHATGDEFYYDAASEVARGLVEAQHASGGWNYLHDFAGEASVRRWYDTIGANGWRLEEFHHYRGNATFDGGGTSEASQLLLRMYMEKRDASFAAPLEKAIRFVLDSQYGNGGWPQRYPFDDDAPAAHGRPDYTRYVTFDDDVAGENITFLLMVWQSLGDERARGAIDRAMNVFLAAQQPAPQAGWGLHHTVDALQPVGARSFEPDALVTSTTAGNVSLLMDFREWTGEAVYLAHIADALDWLDSVRLARRDVVMPGREFPTFVEIGSNRALINHRRGSNVVNGEYYHDQDPSQPIGHYPQWCAIDVAGLRARLERLGAQSPEDAAARSPLRKRANFALPRFFTTHGIEVSDLDATGGSGRVKRPDPSRVAKLVAGLNDAGYWPTPLATTSHPYRGDGAAAPLPGNYAQTQVGDASDTSPYVTSDTEFGISTATFVHHMCELLQAVDRSGAGS